MEFLRMYLGELMGVALMMALLFVAGAVALRYVPAERTRMVRLIRNICIAVIVGTFAASLIPSLAVNEAPKGRLDRSGADKDQKAFELRHTDQGK